jgi:radical SAM protein with 4Fe4S-binding SPASM domain
VFDVTKILCDLDQPPEALRHEREPSVVWYRDGATLDPASASALIEDLALARVPALLLVGDDPCAGATLDIARHARRRGIDVSLVTGTAPLSAQSAAGIAAAGFSCVSIRVGHDVETSAPNLRALHNAGQRTGLQIRLSAETAARLDAIFDFIRAERVERACFSHLVPSGPDEPIPDAESRRAALEAIFEGAQALARGGDARQISTEGNYADSAFAAICLEADGSPLAYRAQRYLEWSAAAADAIKPEVAGIDADGTVHPDRYLRSISLGNVSGRQLSDIWADESIAVVRQLRDPRRYVRGRCERCRFLNVCRGNVRARALAMTGDLWASDPACYLEDSEIA